MQFWRKLFLDLKKVLVIYFFLGDIVTNTTWRCGCLSEPST